MPNRSSDRQLSMWTIIGSVSAAVIAAGILGGVGGVLQIPAMVTDVASLRSDRDLAVRTSAQVNERVRSLELSAEGAQRQLNELVRVRENLLARLDERDRRDRDLDISVQRDLQSMEGRSKERNTEANGAIRTVEASVNAIVERQRAQVEVIGQVRRDLFELASRLARPASQSVPNQPQPGETRQPYYYAPQGSDGDRPRATPQKSIDVISPEQQDATSTRGDRWQVERSTVQSKTQWHPRPTQRHPRHRIASIKRV